MDGAFKYKAFISYSHADQKWASWLHRRLEQYRFPKKTIGRETASGTVPTSLKPIFRDREELTAGANLGEVIEAALSQSENLIVICSPNAVRSHWVGQEILYFKRHNRGAKIFTVIVDGEPWASNLPHRQEEECLPEAIRYELGADGELSDQLAEPLAADFRKEGDGKRFGLLKLISGMVGLGLDDLVQRDLQRARRRVTGITVSAISTLLIMGTLTGIAIGARGEAEKRRAGAEGLIKFMLTDLRDRLEPVGRLDALDAVGEQAKAYYDEFDSSENDPNAQGRRAEVFHLLGDIEFRQGRFSEADQFFDPAFEITERQMRSDPNNPDRVYEHAQSTYWVSKKLHESAEFSQELELLENYLELAERLSELEGNSVRAKQELAYAHRGISGALRWLDQSEFDNIEKAKAHQLESISHFQNLSRRDENLLWEIEVAEGYGLLGSLNLLENNVEAGFSNYEKSASLLSDLRRRNPDDYNLLDIETDANLILGVMHNRRGEFDEAKNRLDIATKAIDLAEQREPNNRLVRQNRARALMAYMNYAYGINDQALYQNYLNQMRPLVREFLTQSKTGSFTRFWDFQIPSEFILLENRRLLMQRDYSASEALFDDFELLIDRLSQVEDLSTDKRSMEVYFHTTKAVVDSDLKSYQLLKKIIVHPDTPEDYENYRMIVFLLSYHFQDNAEDLAGLNYKYQIGDESSVVMKLYEDLYPNKAEGAKMALIYGRQN